MCPGFSRLCAISESGKSVNEDLFGTKGNLAWVLDGMTGHREKPRTPAETDGKWYVKQLDDAFKQLSDRNECLSSIARDAIALVRERFQEVTDEDIDGAKDLPAAAGVLIRRIRTESGPDKIEYLILGDCTLLIEKTKTIVRISDERPVLKEQEQIEAMQQALDDGAETPMDARKQVKNLFVKNKNELNTPGGFWMFGLDPEAADEAITGMFRVSNDLKIHLMTDGFSCLVDTYHVYETWEKAIDCLHESGCEVLISEIREVEDADPMLRKYPRTKPSDDATLLSLTLNDA